MGHDSHSPAHHGSAGSGKQNPLLVPLVLLMFFAMSAVGHYVFVIGGTPHEESVAHHASPEDGTSESHTEDGGTEHPVQEQEDH